LGIRVSGNVKKIPGLDLAAGIGALLPNTDDWHMDCFGIQVRNCYGREKVTTGQAAIKRLVIPAGINWLKYATPQAFFPLAGGLAPWFLAIAVLLFMLGMGVGLLMAPAHAAQGDISRIVFLHVPAAWAALVIYLSIAFWALIGIVLNTRLSFMMGHALAPTGAIFALLALITGALWGKPASGTWWIWDARLTAELILFFLYIGYIALQNAIGDPRRADRACAVLALLGTINLPILYFSVLWWSALHRGEQVALPDITDTAPMMLAATLLTTGGLWAYGVAAALIRVRCVVLERERHADWAIDYAAGQ
jgi:heme exporter protein C